MLFPICQLLAVQKKLHLHDRESNLRTSYYLYVSNKLPTAYFEKVLERHDIHTLLSVAARINTSQVLVHVPVNLSYSSALKNISTFIPVLRLMVIAMAMATMAVTGGILDVSKPRNVEPMMMKRQGYPVLAR